MKKVFFKGGYFECKPMFIEQLAAPKNIDKNIFGKYIKTELKQHGKEIDRKVYKFYGLTEEKIRLLNKIRNLRSCPV